MSEQKEAITLVCLYPCLLTDKKTGVIFKEVINGELQDGELVYSKTGMGKAVLTGGVYTVEGERHKDKDKASQALTLFPGTRQWQHRWENEDDLLEWSAKAKAFSIAAAAEQAIKNEKKRDLIEECLRPLRRVYLKMPAMQQRALEVAVLMALRKKVKVISDG